MGYLHIDNLYKNTDILLFKECYAMEKIHGTSAQISWKECQVRFSPGGCNHDLFKSLFDAKKLEDKFKELFQDTIILYGEAYGGKCQGMSETYGKELKFVVFDVKIGDNWLDVSKACKVANDFGLEFVDYVKIKTDLKLIDHERDKDSKQAIRNNCGTGKMREGVVLRPLMELTKNNGNRIIVKHKRDEFKETKTKREVNPEQLKMIENAKSISEEWVTLMRLEHVLDKLGNPTEIEKTGLVIKAMIKDVTREAKGEIKESKLALQMIGKKTAEIYKKRISKI